MCLLPAYYLADLGTDKRNLPIHYYDTNQLTLYIRSFSKTFIPGIRLGAMVIPNTPFMILSLRKGIY